MPNSPAAMAEAFIRNLPKNTGKGIDQWKAIVRASGPETPKARIDWLKREHGLGNGQASLIVQSLDQSTYYGGATDADLLNNQYAGPKASLRPMYDTLAAEIAALGADARLEMRKTYVSLNRARQFGLIQATTRDRVDLGLRLKGEPGAGRLIEAPAFGSGTITHRIALTSPADVSDEVRRWLRRAFEAAG